MCLNFFLNNLKLHEYKMKFHKRSYFYKQIVLILDLKVIKPSYDFTTWLCARIENIEKHIQVIMEIKMYYYNSY